MKIIICKHCKNQLEFINDSGVRPVCCHEEMQELIPNTVEASKEKHIPVVEINGDEVIVKVGSIDHPMLPEHHIAYIILETNLGIMRKELNVENLPHAKFKILKNEKITAAYEYCNLHGLWKLEV